MICPQCKTRNPEGSLLCSRCGHSLASAGVQSSFETPVAPGTNNPAPVNFVPMAMTSGGAVEEGTPYKASGRLNASGVPRLLVAGLVSAIVVGVIYAFISRFFNLLIVFPLAAGFLVGLGLTFAVTAGKVRNGKITAVVAVLAGLLMMGVVDFATAMSERAEMIDAFTQSEVADLATPANGKAPSPAQLATLEKTTRAEISGALTPLRTFALYEIIAAEAGTSIGRPGSGSGIPIQGVFYYLLRAFELLLVAGVSAAVATGAANAPFCENCQKWHQEESVLKRHPGQNALVAEKISARDWNGLMDVPPGEAPDDKNVTTVKITHCPDCSSGTLSATSLGATAPPEFAQINIAPASTQTLRQKASAANAPTTG